MIRWGLVPVFILLSAAVGFTEPVATPSGHLVDVPSGWHYETDEEGVFTATAPKALDARLGEFPDETVATISFAPAMMLESFPPESRNDVLVFAGFMANFAAEDALTVIGEPALLDQIEGVAAVSLVDEDGVEGMFFAHLGDEWLMFAIAVGALDRDYDAVLAMIDSALD